MEVRAGAAGASQGQVMAHWLLKTEPDVFSFDDLMRAPNRTSGWDGVRNYQARNFLRDGMKKGDGVLISRSSRSARRSSRSSSGWERSDGSRGAVCAGGARRRTGVTDLQRNVRRARAGAGDAGDDRGAHRRGLAQAHSGFGEPGRGAGGA